MLTLVKQLSVNDRQKLTKHFLALPPEDVYLRFGNALNSAAIGAYVDNLDFARDALFGVYSDTLALNGVAHLAPVGDAAELGISVLRGYRGLGVGTAIFNRALEHARNLNLDSLFVHFLSENLVPPQIARKLGLVCVARGSESEASISLLPGNAETLWNEWSQDCMALYDYGLKSQVELFKSETAVFHNSTRATMDANITRAAPVCG